MHPYRSFPFSGCERQETPMSKAFVEGFGFEMIVKRLEKVLNDYGFACEVVYLGEPKQIPVKTTAIGYSGSLPSHDGRSIAVLALPNSLVHAVLRYPHLVESEHVYARLTPEQAILALGYIDGTSVESDGNNAALNVNHLAYYLHKCSKIKIVREPSRYEDLTAAEQADSMPNTPIRK